MPATVLPFWPLDGGGSGLIDVRRGRAEMPAESLIINDELLFPLIEHLGKVTKQRDGTVHRLDDPRVN
jgi:hypothetical protein